MSTFKTQSDREIVEEIFGNYVTLDHRISERFAEDIKDALREILAKYDKMLYEVEIAQKAEEHIEKLERMLDRRKARYKRWEDVY